jgi:hypothetical protein
MLSTFSPPLAPRAGLGLSRRPSNRQQSVRRRLVIGGAIVGLALASAALGVLVRPAQPLPAHAATGPFSYFPTQ